MSQSGFIESVSSYGSQCQVNGTVPAPRRKALESEEPSACLTHGALSVLAVHPRAESEAASVTKATSFLGAAKESG